MKKIVLLLAVSFIFTSCASFNPIPLNYVNAVEHPDAVEKDSVYVYGKMIGNVETGRIVHQDRFAQDKEPINGMMLCISNRSHKNLTYKFSSTPELKRLRNEDAKSKYDVSPVAHLVLWSIPWVANIAAGLPVYYGIAFPLIGLIELVKGEEVNKKIDFYFAENSLPKSIPAMKTANGIIYVVNSEFENFKIDFYDEGTLYTSLEFVPR